MNLYKINDSEYVVADNITKAIDTYEMGRCLDAPCVKVEAIEGKITVQSKQATQAETPEETFREAADRMREKLAQDQQQHPAYAKPVAEVEKLI